MNNKYFLPQELVGSNLDPRKIKSVACVQPKMGHYDIAAGQGHTCGNYFYVDNYLLDTHLKVDLNNELYYKNVVEDVGYTATANQENLFFYLVDNKNRKKKLLLLVYTFIKFVINAYVDVDMTLGYDTNESNAKSKYLLTKNEIYNKITDINKSLENFVLTKYDNEASYSYYSFSISLNFKEADETEIKDENHTSEYYYISGKKTLSIIINIVKLNTIQSTTITFPIADYEFCKKINPIKKTFFFDITYNKNNLSDDFKFLDYRIIPLLTPSMVKGVTGGQRKRKTKKLAKRRKSKTQKRAKRRRRM